MSSCKTTRKSKKKQNEKKKVSFSIGAEKVITNDVSSSEEEEEESDNSVEFFDDNIHQKQVKIQDDYTEQNKSKNIVQETHIIEARFALIQRALKNISKRAECFFKFAIANDELRNLENYVKHLEYLTEVADWYAHFNNQDDIPYSFFPKWKPMYRDSDIDKQFVIFYNFSDKTFYDL